MNQRLIGDVLKDQRNKAGLSVKYVSEYMTSKGYKASEKTIYGWESNFSMPNAEPLLALCNLYGITNVLDTFGYGKELKTSSTPYTPEALEVACAYDKAALKDKNIVRTALDLPHIEPKGENLPIAKVI